jgi:DNA-binding transcriptional ArsR family regulator
MSSRAATISDRTLDAVFSALAHRARRRILRRLAGGPATVGELASPFSMTLPAVSKHIRILEGAGLVRRERDGWYHRCRLDGRPLETASAFLDGYRTFWTETLAELARYVERPVPPARARPRTRPRRERRP